MLKRHHIQSLFINPRWYWLMTGCVVVFILSFLIKILFAAAIVLTGIALCATTFDFYLLYLQKGVVSGKRKMRKHFSLGDENEIALLVQNCYSFPIEVTLVEQLPVQFQQRNFQRRLHIAAKEERQITYSLRPEARGEYHFGFLLCYVRSPLQLLERRFEADAEITVKVYPSYVQLQKQHLLATGDSLSTGQRKIRRSGHSLEFEKIKSYIQGDDIRTINWKATARSAGLMVNTFTDAREQQVYVLIDKGRSMKMPFDGLTLLDHAINASLSLLNVVMMKHDKAGLITFSSNIHTLVPAEKRTGQLQRLSEALYKQETDFKEPDYELLLATISKKLSQRSLLILFTNFETLSSLERQLPLLVQLSSKHLVCVVFFQNTLLRKLQETQPDTTEGIYIKTIADRFDYEKKLIVKELRRHGIVALLTTPAQLTTAVINKYLELKTRQMI